MHCLCICTKDSHTKGNYVQAIRTLKYIMIEIKFLNHKMKKLEKNYIFINLPPI